MTRAIIFAGAAVLLVLVLNNAWVTEDAYISFRTLDNFVHGYGLRWNATERSQAFTHPLWLFLHVPFYLVTREVFLTTIAISTATALGAFLLGARVLHSQRPWVALIAVVPLGFSSAFLDYSTSGLENPLTFVFLAWFAHELLVRDAASPTRLALVAGLGALNRPDTILFFAPVLAWVLLSGPILHRVRQFVTGFSPLLAWEAFSLFYYGFPFPNSRYAKLPPNVDFDWYYGNGLLYVLSLIRHDPVSACLIVGGLVVSSAAAAGWMMRRSGDPAPDGFLKVALFGLGLLLNCLYVVYVGGDFMRGRFLAGPVFAATLLLWHTLPVAGLRDRARWGAVAVAVLTFLAVRYDASDTRWYNVRTRITDERKYYEETNTLQAYLEGRRVSDHSAARHGKKFRAEAAKLRAAGSDQPYVVAHKYVGMRGFYGGPDVVIIDQLALTEPLLARLGVRYPRSWRVGHGERVLPDGYLEARRTGSLDGMDPALREYYALLRHIVSGPLFDMDRIAAIVRLNLGFYDHLLREYEARQAVTGPRSRR